MNKKFLLLIGLVLAAGVAALLALAAGRENGQSPTPRPTPLLSPSPSPTVDLLTPADRALLTRLSTELAVKYRSFERVDQAYVNSIRPYLTKQFFEDYRSTLRYADRAPFLQPVKSKALETTVSGNSADGKSTAVVKLDSTELKTGRRFEQTLQIEWQRFGDRWSATDIHALEFDKE